MLNPRSGIIRLTRRPKPKTVLGTRRLNVRVPELKREPAHAHSDKRARTYVSVQVNAYRCPVCRKTNTYVVVNGNIVAGCGGVTGGQHGFEISYCGQSKDCMLKAEGMIETAIAKVRVQEALCA
jgi:hypothetical protein